MIVPREFNQNFCAAYKRFSWRFAGKMILLLTTTGRKTGLARTTPVQYEKINEEYYVGAANGLKSDWVRNLQADPRAIVQVKNQVFEAAAAIVTDTEQITNFLVYRLKKHPIMLRLILKADGCSFHPDRLELLNYAGRLTLVRLHPIK